MDERERWDARHAERAGREEEPDPFVAEALARLGPGAGRRALDLASGTGRHALALAERGWEAQAWDRSPVAGRVLAERAARRGLRVGWRELDLERGSFPAQEAPFELVVLVNYLDRGLLARVGELLGPGGLFVFATFTTEREGQRPRAERCLAPGELARGLAGYETLAYQEGAGRAGLLARRRALDGRASEPGSAVEG